MAPEDCPLSDDVDETVCVARILAKLRPVLSRQSPLDVAKRMAVP